MSTRGIINIIEDNEVLVRIYNQSGSFPYILGQKLADFLAGFKIVNGLSLEKQDAKIANGMGCLAAQLIKYLKEEPGGIYIVPPGDHAQEYEYYILEIEGKLYIVVYNDFIDKHTDLIPVDNYFTEIINAEFCHEGEYNAG